MASTIEKKTSVEERRSYILGVLKNNGEIVTHQRELADSIGISQSVISKDMRYLSKMYPNNIKKLETAGIRGGYFWVEEKKEMPERYGVEKNDEGYSDPTAAMVIKNLDTVYKRGSIYEYNCSNGSIEKWLVINSYGSQTACVRVYDSYNDISEKEKVEIFTVGTKTSPIYCNPHRIHTKPNRYFADMVGKVTDVDFKIVTGKINEYLGLCPVVYKEKLVEVPVEIEKIVEKEVPVEVQVEMASEETQAIISELTRELELVTQRADIYQSVCEGLIGRNA